jgi:hypothetical protein
VVVADLAETCKEPQVRAFEALREILAHPEFLVAPQPLAPKILVTDVWPRCGAAAVGGRGYRPVAFASRK